MTFMDFLLDRADKKIYFGMKYADFFFEDGKSESRSPSNGVWFVLRFGVEYIFENNELCFIEYNMDRISQVFLSQHKVTRKSSGCEIEKYLTEIGVDFSISREETLKITTSTGVELFFDDNEQFIRAMKSIYLA
ncbi:hypothetical protein [Serratia microhaemolytica]|uniref:hypothetical protein n=1 Tax=Serratia microhaemolytica TaxID=2675110 RepID=UPI000FDE1FA2|nr:hypothetical protein [Serratia microhaemolytica]